MTGAKIWTPLIGTEFRLVAHTTPTEAGGTSSRSLARSRPDCFPRRPHRQRRSVYHLEAVVVDPSDCTARTRPCRCTTTLPRTARNSWRRRCRRCRHRACWRAWWRGSGRGSRREARPRSSGTRCPACSASSRCRCGRRCRSGSKRRGAPGPIWRWTCTMNECPDWLVAPVTQSLVTREYMRSVIFKPSFSQPYPVRRVWVRACVCACVLLVLL